MLKAAKISIAQAKKNIFVFAAINCLAYIISLLAFKYLNLLHIWGLRMADYLIFAIISIWQIRRWISRNHGYVPFLQAFFTILFTGAFSFLLFGAFLLIYSFSDPYLTGFFVTNTGQPGKLIPSIIVIFEGGGASIIVALIASFYAARYEDGEISS